MKASVSILGCGTIGAAWAALFLAKGCRVQAFDPKLDAVLIRNKVEIALASLRALGTASGDSGELFVHTQLADAVEGAVFVQESVSEDLGGKHELYAHMAAHLDPEAIVASSTSFLMPSELQEGCPFAERLCVGHPFNPPHLIPLVELVAGKATLPKVMDRAAEVYEALGKRVVRLKKEATGHLVNRLQAALWREAIFAVTDGIADLADVDAAIAYGPGLRWALMGPHLTFHLAGGDGGMKRFIEHLGPANEAAWDALGEARLDEATSAKLVEGCAKATQGLDIAELRQRRDAQLLALLKSTDRVL